MNKQMVTDAIKKAKVLYIHGEYKKIWMRKYDLICGKKMEDHI